MFLTDEQYMQMARMAKEHADCKGRHVGAAMVLSNGSVLFGANGSPDGHTKCVDGGCYRCSHRDRDEFSQGKGYDVCTCVHAEGACIAAASAEPGISVKGATVYSTMRPCRECTKYLLHAGIHAVYYEDDWLPEDADQLAAYLDLQKRFPGGVRQLLPATLPATLGMTEVRVEVPLN